MKTTIDPAWMQRVADRLAPVFADGVRNNFLGAEGPDGPWPPRRDNEPHPLLNKDGDLLTAATVGAEASPRVDGNIVTFSVPPGGARSVRYAYVHDGGEHVPYGGGRVHGIPQREFFYASEATLGRMEEVVADEAETVLFD